MLAQLCVLGELDRVLAQLSFCAPSYLQTSRTVSRRQEAANAAVLTRCRTNGLTAGGCPGLIFVPRATIIFRTGRMTQRGKSSTLREQLGLIFVHRAVRGDTGRLNFCAPALLTK